MKQKITKLFQTSLLTVFAFVGVFGFLGAPNAQAACNYGITRMDAQSSVNKTGTLTINTTITRQGSSDDCANNVFLNYYVKANYITSDNQGNPQTEDEVQLGGNKNISFNGLNEQSFGTQFSLSGFDWSKVPNQNQLQLFARLYANNTLVQSSGVWNINITGSSGTSPSSGARSINISFDRATYNKDDRIDIIISLSNSSNAKNVEIVTVINGREVGSYNKTASQIVAAQKQTVTVGPSANFQNGTNTVKVVMYEQNTNRSILFAEGSGQVQAQGLTTTTPTTPTPGGTGGATQPGGATPTNGVKTDCLATPNSADCLYNPLPTGDLTTMFLLIAKGTLGLVAVWAVIFIIVGGFRMVTSAGNEEAYGVAKKTVTWAILGVVIAVLSFSMVAIVEDLLKADIQNVSETTGTTPK